MGEVEEARDKLRAAGIDAWTEGSDCIRVGPGDATTFADLVAGRAASGTERIVEAVARMCPHFDEDEQECFFCHWDGGNDDWPGARDEHSPDCTWVLANDWRHQHA